MRERERKRERERERERDEGFVDERKDNIDERKQARIRERYEEAVTNSNGLHAVLLGMLTQGYSPAVHSEL